MLVPRRTQPNRVPNGHFSLCNCCCRKRTLVTKTSRSGSELSDLKGIPTFSTCDLLCLQLFRNRRRALAAPLIREEFHSNNTRRRTTATASCSTLGGRKANCHSFGQQQNGCVNNHTRKKREPHTECRNRTTHNAKVCCLTAHSTKAHALGFSGFSLAVYFIDSWVPTLDFACSFIFF